MPPKAAAKGQATGAVKKRAPARPQNVHKLPKSINEGEILRDTTKKQWRLGRSIGVGGFGEIYTVSEENGKPVSPDAKYVVKIEPHSNGPLFVEMNFYIRCAKPEMIDTWMKSKKLNQLGMPRFIGSGSHEYKGEKYRFMIMERFGSDIQKLLDSNQKRFPFQTVCNLSLQIIDVLEYVHSRDYVHADIKASNLLLGYEKRQQNCVYLVDYGLACRYVGNDGVHKEYKPDVRKAHNGTIEFTSRDAHIGANARRSDLEILGYNVVQWLCGKLPWEDNLKDCEYVARQKQRYMSDIPTFLKTCFPSGHPPVVEKFLKYVAGLKFEEAPDYSYCRQLFKQGLKEAGFSDDGKLVFLPVESPKKMKKSSTVPSAISSVPKKIPATAKRAERLAEEGKSKRATRSNPGSPSLTSAGAELEPSGSGQVKLGKAARADSKKVALKTKSRSPKKRRDPSLANPTPVMLALMNKFKERSQSPSFPVKKKASSRSSSGTSSPTAEGGDIPTPAMEEVIQRRNERMSLGITEAQSFYVTPTTTPNGGDKNSSSESSFSGIIPSPPLPCATKNRPKPPRLFSTLETTTEGSPEAEDTPPVRKKKKVPGRRQYVVSDSSESTPSPSVLKRKKAKRPGLAVKRMATIGTQTSPTVYMPHLRVTRSRAANSPLAKSSPVVITLDESRDLFSE